MIKDISYETRQGQKINKLSFEQSDVVEKPLWYHKQNLMQTATGYGSKLRTEKMLKIGNKLHRIYCRIYSNSGTLYIVKNKTDYIVEEY